MLPGPYATMMLADLGADVLRVESPTRPDLLRNSNPKVGESSAAHGYLNRSKHSIALNLKKPEAVELVRRLIKHYDIVLEQFRPGVMDRLGLGYTALKEINPKLIYCSLSGFGQTGPLRNRPGHDINYLSLAGIADYSGCKKCGPLPLGIQAADVAGGSLHTVIGILSAVVYRERTGLGQAIDISITDASFALNGIAGSGYLAGGEEPEQGKMLLNGGTFYNYYATKDGRFVSVGSLEPHFRKQLCDGIGRPELFELSISEDTEDIQVFKAALRRAFISKTCSEWEGIFSNLEACVESVLKFSEACEHPQIKDRAMVVNVPNPDGTKQRQIACPIKFSGFSPKYKFAGVRVGANTQEILRKLGISAAEYDNLQAKGVFG